MSGVLKRIFALLMSALLVLGGFSGCAGEKDTVETTEPDPTQSSEEAAVLKVLTLGHSLTVDSCFMLNLVAKTEGYCDMVIGTLYYSGCPLSKHVELLTNNGREYELHVSSTGKPYEPPEIMTDVTMQEAIRHDYWDIIILQGSGAEIAEETAFKAGYIQTIQAYVNEQKLNPTAVFGWHMPWVGPVDDDLRNMYTLRPNVCFTEYEKYDHDRTKYYNAITKSIADNIVTDKTFTCLIPSGTAIENALSSYLTEKDLYRDYSHASDFGRLIAAYTWYCVLAGVESLTEIKLDAIPKAFVRSFLSAGDYVLSDMEKAIVVESVNNALKNPLQMTQSQYIEVPVN